MNEQELQDALEALVDKTTLARVLDALSGVCDAKMEHLQTNWQDATSARHWSDMGTRLAIESSAAQRKFGL